jgi:hypothetical protein
MQFYNFILYNQLVMLSKEVGDFRLVSCVTRFRHKDTNPTIRRIKMSQLKEQPKEQSPSCTGSKKEEAPCCSDTSKEKAPSIDPHKK